MYQSACQWESDTATILVSFMLTLKKPFPPGWLLPLCPNNSFHWMYTQQQGPGFKSRDFLCGFACSPSVCTKTKTYKTQRLLISFTSWLNKGKLLHDLTRDDVSTACSTVSFKLALLMSVRWLYSRTQQLHHKKEKQAFLWSQGCRGIFWRFQNKIF